MRDLLLVLLGMVIGSAAVALLARPPWAPLRRSLAHTQRADIDVRVHGATKAERTIASLTASAGRLAETMERVVAAVEKAGALGVNVRGDAITTSRDARDRVVAILNEAQGKRAVPEPYDSGPPRPIPPESES